MVAALEKDIQQLHQTYIITTGCSKKKLPVSVKSDLAQWKINIFERFKNQKNRAVSAFLLIFEPVKKY